MRKPTIPSGYSKATANPVTSRPVAPVKKPSLGSTVTSAAGARSGAGRLQKLRKTAKRIP